MDGKDVSLVESEQGLKWAAEQTAEVFMLDKSRMLHV